MKRREGFLIKPHKKIKINFIPNNFRFDKTCKVIMHDDAQKEKNKQI
jgi:hypothetical protein